MRAIAPGELAVGQALPWDVYGDGGNLLARKGYHISNDAQIEVLLKRGRVPAVEQARASEEPPSVLRMINAVNRRLALILAEIALGRCADAETKLAETGRYLISAIDLHPDVALACIMHNQDAGPYAIRHSIDTAILSLLVARALKKSDAEQLCIVVGALCMNVGMLEHQERMQYTQEPLDARDRALIKEHPEAGAFLLRKAGIQNEDWLECVLYHHENENGSGYPFGRLGHQLPLSAKIVSLADRYCARVSSRAYRKSMLPNAALRDILLEGKSTIDPQLAAVFIRELGIYPVGTYVRLINGEIGVVTRKGVNTATPIVDALVGPRGAPLDHAIKRDTKNELHAIREVLHAAQAAIGFNLDQLWGRVAAV
ncbi:HD-GYP domain-containing protein [Massilia sp. TS11]|uniref:HD-GYP domain-containing protein n=1 Tax=Massilia sp. TS11 TaxID=2908003 RepID=UPI001EDA5D0A|nr:HD domain-containing phosphohydrolase [Massilia sp. TS11]MCG2585091.1 HD domain-containing protein [Massilia sp. TS11]